MGKTEDWVPSNMEEFKKFGDKFTNKANTNRTAWNLNSDDVDELVLLRDAFNPLEEVSSDKVKRNTLDVEKTDDARLPYEKLIRKIGINQMKGNDLMSNDQRTDIGVHNNSNTHTQSPVEETSPVIQAENKGELGLAIRYSPVGNPKSHALPDGQEAVIVKFGFYKKGDAVPTEKQCTQTEILGKSPAFVTFDGDNKGLLFVGYARYINTRKQLGLVATTFYGVVS